MPSKQELTSAYQKALLDESYNTPFQAFRDPNEMGKTVKGRLTQHKGMFYAKTPANFYFLGNNKKIQEIFSKDQNIEINCLPPQTKINGVTVQAELIL